MSLKSKDCSHCDGAGYVLDGRWEEALERRALKLKDLPAAVLEILPHEFFYPCHCNTVLLIRAGEPLPKDTCSVCDGTTWKFSGRAGGFQSKKVSSVPSTALHSLPCGYFERCSCRDGRGDFQHTPGKQEALTDFLRFLRRSASSELGFLFP